MYNLYTVRYELTCFGGVKTTRAMKIVVFGVNIYICSETAPQLRLTSRRESTIVYGFSVSRIKGTLYGF